MAEEWTDEELLAGLAEYLRHADPVPSHLIAAAKATHQRNQLFMSCSLLLASRVAGG